MQGEKSKLRRDMRALHRKKHDISVRYGEALHDLVHVDRGFINAQTVALFASLPDEVDTSPLDQLSRRMGKSVVYPRLDRKALTMNFYKTQALADLVAQESLLREPNSNLSDVAVQDIDLFFMPGLAFTENGDRLGRGKGYYDRTLGKEAFRSALRYGIAYPWQVTERIPTESFDLSVDKVFTPEKVFVASRPV